VVVSLDGGGDVVLVNADGYTHNHVLRTLGYLIIIVFLEVSNARTLSQ
jgi:hypothetical protein